MYPGWSPAQQFQAWYATELGKLTFNSRPIIDKLSMAALERKREGDWEGMGVVGEVLRRGIEVVSRQLKEEADGEPVASVVKVKCRNEFAEREDILPIALQEMKDISGAVVDLSGEKNMAPPTQKLPLFYLVDSIAKNAGAPYTTHILPSFLAQTYLNAYHQVDPLTRKKMEDMLTTWRTTPGTGTPEGELFPREVRSAIEMGIYGRQVPLMPQSMYPAPGPTYAPSVHLPPASPFVPTPPPQSYMQPTGPTRDTVMTSLLTILSAKRAIVAKNPHDVETRGTVQILEQLQALLMAGNVSPQELGAIQAQLDSFRSDPPRVETYPRPAPPPVETYARPPQPPITMPKPMHLPVPMPLGMPRMGTLPMNPTQSSNVGPPPVQNGAPAPSLDFSSLLGNLARAGILSQTGTPVQGAQASTGNERAPTAEREADPEEADGMDEYEELILGMNVQLTLADLTKPRAFQPTSHLPNRCSQCAARFAAGKKGKDRLQQHLDWHFRRNRKEREGEARGRGANRRWLPRAEAWVNDIAEAFTGVRDEDIDAGPSTSGMAPRPSASALAQQRLNEELVKKWVVVPAEEKAGGGKRRCPICKEEFVDEFVQDEEEWVWRNCVKVKNSYYHATCRADALATAAANRKATAASATDPQTALLRGASPSGTASREGTPVPVGVKSEITQSPLRKTVKMETDKSADAGALSVNGEVQGDVTESNSLKRKAAASPEVEKDVKKEKSE